MPKSPESEGGPRLMTVTEIAEAHGVSRQSVHSYRTRGSFPKPVEGEGSTRPRFRADEVDAWFKANPPRQGKRTDLAEKPESPEEPRMATPTDARSDLYAFAMQGKEHSPANSERASEKIDAFRAAVIDEVVTVLRERAGEYSQEAEEEMRRDLEEQAQKWHSAADAAGRLKGGKLAAEPRRNTPARAPASASDEGVREVAVQPHHSGTVDPDTLPMADGCEYWRKTHRGDEVCPMSTCARCRYLEAL